MTPYSDPSEKKFWLFLYRISFLLKECVRRVQKGARTKTYNPPDPFRERRSGRLSLSHLGLDPAQMWSTDLVWKRLSRDTKTKGKGFYSRTVATDWLRASRTTHTDTHLQRIHKTALWGSGKLCRHLRCCKGSQQEEFPACSPSTDANCNLATIHSNKCCPTPYLFLFDLLVYGPQELDASRAHVSGCFARRPHNMVVLLVSLKSAQKGAQKDRQPHVNVHQRVPEPNPLPTPWACRGVSRTGSASGSRRTNAGGRW